MPGSINGSNNVPEPPSPYRTARGTPSSSPHNGKSSLHLVEQNTDRQNPLPKHAQQYSSAAKPNGSASNPLPHALITGREGQHRLDGQGNDNNSVGSQTTDNENVVDIDAVSLATNATDTRKKHTIGGALHKTGKVVRNTVNKLRGEGTKTKNKNSEPSNGVTSHQPPIKRESRSQAQSTSKTDAQAQVFLIRALDSRQKEILKTLSHQAQEHLNTLTPTFTDWVEMSNQLRGRAPQNKEINPQKTTTCSETGVDVAELRWKLHQLNLQTLAKIAIIEQKTDPENNVQSPEDWQNIEAHFFLHLIQQIETRILSTISQELSQQTEARLNELTSTQRIIWRWEMRAAQAAPPSAPNAHAPTGSQVLDLPNSPQAWLAAKVADYKQVATDNELLYLHNWENSETQFRQTLIKQIEERVTTQDLEEIEEKIKNDLKQGLEPGNPIDLFSRLFFFDVDRNPRNLQKYVEVCRTIIGSASNQLNTAKMREEFEQNWKQFSSATSFPEGLPQNTWEYLTNIQSYLHAILADLKKRPESAVDTKLTAVLLEPRLNLLDEVIRAKAIESGISTPPVITLEQPTAAPREWRGDKQFFGSQWDKHLPSRPVQTNQQIFFNWVRSLFPSEASKAKQVLEATQSIIDSSENPSADTAKLSREALRKTRRYAPTYVRLIQQLNHLRTQPQAKEKIEKIESRIQNIESKRVRNIFDQDLASKQSLKVNQFGQPFSPIRSKFDTVATKNLTLEQHITSRLINCYNAVLNDELAKSVSADICLKYIDIVKSRQDGNLVIRFEELDPKQPERSEQRALFTEILALTQRFLPATATQHEESAHEANLSKFIQMGIDRTQMGVKMGIIKLSAAERTALKGIVKNPEIMKQALSNFTLQRGKWTVVNTPAARSRQITSERPVSNTVPATVKQALENTIPATIERPVNDTAASARLENADAGRRLATSNNNPFFDDSIGPADETVTDSANQPALAV